jgi:ketol-acid reductoisomerase
LVMSAKRAFRANLPVFEELYKSVRNGTETRRSLDFNGRKTYREDLQKELTEIDNQEIWRAGKTVRGLRVSRRDLYHPRTDS